MNYQFICKTAPAIEPVLWRKFNPRLYKNTDRYGSPMVAGATLASAALTLRDHGQGVAQTQNVIYLAAAELCKYDVPALFVAPELAQAAFLSKPDENMRWDTLALPFEAALLMLPRGLFAHPEFGPVDYVGYARTRAGVHQVPLPNCPQIATKNDNFIVFTGLRDSPGFQIYDRTFNAQSNPTIADKLPDDPHIYEEGKFYIPLAADEHEFLSNLTALVFRLLLVLVARPEQLETGRRYASPKKRGGQEVWLPNIVGRQYRAQPASLGTAGGAGGRKRLHWRRGHFRNQAIGPGLTGRRLIWIEPMLVGAD